MFKMTFSYSKFEHSRVTQDSVFRTVPHAFLGRPLVAKFTLSAQVLTEFT